MKCKSLIKMLFSLLLVAAISIGCGGDEPGTNTGQNHGLNDAGTDADGDSDGDADTDGDAEIPEGSVFFVAPAEETFYTNDVVDFEIGVNDDPEDIELYVDGELLGAVGDDLMYSWSTLGGDEGSYLIQIHYTVDGGAEVAAQERTIVVDRTAPELIFSAPEASAEEVLAQTPITVSFSEPLDPASVNTDTVILKVGEQDLEYTLSLANGDSAINVEFDRSQAVTPYDATLTIDGVTDLAQNPADQEVITWNVPAFMQEPIIDDPQILQDYSIVHANGTDFLIARQIVNNLSRISVFRGHPEPWGDVAYVDLEALDIDAVAHNDMIYIAVLHRRDVLGSYQRRINIYEFDPVDWTLEDFAQVGSVGNDDGTHNGSISMAFNDDVGIIASVSDKTLRLHEFTDLDFSTGDNKLAADAFPNALYNNMRTYVDEDDGLHVAFTHCAIEQGVCRNNRLRYVTKGAGDEEWAPAGNSNYHTGFGSQDCNKLTGYDAYLGADEPILTMSYRSNCDNTSDPMLNARVGATLEDIYFANINLAVLVPDAAAADRFVPRLLPNGDGLDVLLSSPNHISLAYAEEGESLEFVKFLDTGLTPDGGAEQYSHTEMFRTELGLMVVFQFDESTYIFRANE